VGTALDTGVGARPFGGDVGGGRVSWPSGPTWLLYSGDDSHCMESVPLLLRLGTFCDAFVAQARVFRTYHSWVLSMMLRQVCSHALCSALMRCAVLRCAALRCAVLWPSALWQFLVGRCMASDHLD